jgi:hypothetical protein
MGAASDDERLDQDQADEPPSVTLMALSAVVLQVLDLEEVEGLAGVHRPRRGTPARS